MKIIILILTLIIFSCTSTVKKPEVKQTSFRDLDSTLKKSTELAKSTADLARSTANKVGSLDQSLRLEEAMMDTREKEVNMLLLKINLLQHPSRKNARKFDSAAKIYTTAFLHYTATYDSVFKHKP